MTLSCIFLSCLSPTSVSQPPSMGLSRCCCLVTQSCPTLRGSMDCSPPGFSVHGGSLGRNTGVSCHALLQRIFPTQGQNPALPHCRQILCHLSHQGSPEVHGISQAGILGWVAISFSRASSQPRD